MKSTSHSAIHDLLILPLHPDLPVTHSAVSLRLSNSTTAGGLHRETTLNRMIEYHLSARDKPSAKRHFIGELKGGWRSMSCTAFSFGTRLQCPSIFCAGNIVLVQCELLPGCFAPMFRREN